MTAINDVVPPVQSKTRSARQGKNKASANVKNGRKLAGECSDKNALSLAMVRLTDERTILEIDSPLVLLTLRINYGLQHTAMSRWNDTGTKVRLAAATAAMRAAGKRIVPFTINFADRFQSTLAKKADERRGASAHVKKQLGRGLKAAGIDYDDQLYWFALEAVLGDDLDDPCYYKYHAHGVIAVPDGFSDDDLAAALKKAGGKMDKFDNQIDFGVLWFDDGWLAYVTKHMAEIQAHTGDKASGMSSEASKLTKHFYSQLKSHVDNLCSE